MKTFMGADFLLHSQTAQTLFDKYAADMPIFDYHNHLSAKEIYERQRYENITQVWLGGDHYKWRAMRIMGVPEEYITGDAPDREKFQKWAETVEHIPGNPLYHWTHLELQRYFGVDEPLTGDSAERIWNACNEKLAQPGYDALGLLEQRKVVALCTTDEPFDSLEWHLKIKNDPEISLQVLPTFRPDRLMNAAAPDFAEAVHLMEVQYGIKIRSLDDLKTGLRAALKHFQNAGCLLADHGYLTFAYQRGGDADKVFRKALDGQKLSDEESLCFCSEMQFWLGKQYAKRGMAMQMHLGAQRNNNTALREKLGINIGCDSVGAPTNAAQLSACLDDLAKKDALPNTILYCLNPCDNAMMSTMAVNFASAPVKGKVQFGAAWWFEDHVRGIRNQMDELLETGLISTFVGMLTDSRSFTSFTRHEYFRRILCDKLGALIEDGEYPNDLETMGRMVQDICFNNAAAYFGLNRKDA